MIFELIAVIVAGIAMGGVVLIVRRFAPALPRWLLPVAAGLAMIGASVSLEYSWYARMARSLPDGVVVATTHENQAFWRPWTYVTPYVDRFVAVNPAGALTRDTDEGQRIVSLYLFARWMPTRHLRAAFDCATGRRADLFLEDAFAADGSIPEDAWTDTGLDDPVTHAACRVG